MSYGPELKAVNIDPEKSNRLIAEAVMLHSADPKARENLDFSAALELEALLLTATRAPKGFPSMDRLLEKIKS